MEALGVHWGDDFIFGIPDDRADDLEQLMRELSMAWNAEGFSWTHDPEHTLAMADGFGFNVNKQLGQTKWNVPVAPGSKRVGKGLREGADNLDEQETQQYRSRVGTALPEFSISRNAE